MQAGFTRKTRRVRRLQLSVFFCPLCGCVFIAVIAESGYDQVMHTIIADNPSPNEFVTTCVT